MLLAKLFLNYYYYKFTNYFHFQLIFLHFCIYFQFERLGMHANKTKIQFLHSISCVTWLLNFFPYPFLFSKLKIKTYRSDILKIPIHVFY